MNQNCFKLFSLFAPALLGENIVSYKLERSRSVKWGFLWLRDSGLNLGVESNNLRKVFLPISLDRMMTISRISQDKDNLIRCKSV